MLRYFLIASLLYVSCEPPRRNVSETDASKEAAPDTTRPQEKTPDANTYKRRIPKRNSIQDSLIDAVNYGDTALITLLVKRGADVNARDEHLFFPLYWAQYDQQYKQREDIDSTVIKMLLALGAMDYNAKLSGLFNASRNGNLDSVKMLINQGNVNARRVWYDPAEEDGSCNCYETPVSAAAASGNPKLVQFLIEHGAEINFDADGLPPLAVALRKQDYAIADLLMQRGAKKESTFAIDEASFYAYHDYDTAYLDYLIKNQIPYASFDGPSPLRTAASTGNISILKRLIPVTSIEERNSALCFALNSQVAGMLLKSGADINSIYFFHGEGGCSGVDVPVCKAVSSGDLNYIKFLVEKGANVNLLDSYMRDDANVDSYFRCSVISPLTLAIQAEKSKIAEYLIEHGANVNFIIKDRYGEGHFSPLIIAVQKNNLAMTKLLLSKGALATNRNVSIKDYVTAATLGEIVQLLHKQK